MNVPQRTYDQNNINNLKAVLMHSGEKRGKYLTRLVLGGIGLVDLVVEPHVSDGHPVLGQGARLVRADGGGGAQRFHSLQVLYQAVLTSHSLSSQCQTHLRARRDKNKEGKGGMAERT